MAKINQSEVVVKHACEEISHLASERLERDLSLKERLMMRVHFLMCSACKHYAKNMDKLHNALKLKQVSEAGLVHLPQEKRFEIEKTLKKLPEKG
ncbi:MAG: zf-HC2 domain-containing protein [Ghiorsea sp.]